MPIFFDESKKIFRLDTATTSYSIMLGPCDSLLHLYYGAKIPDLDLENLAFTCSHSGFSPRLTYDDNINYSKSCSRLEYSSFGCGDFRTTPLMIRRSTGTCEADLTYRSHRILKGKPRLPGLPATYATEEEADTLELVCIDLLSGAEVTLVYTVFANYGAMTRHVRIKNTSEESFHVCRADSVCLDLHYAENMDFIHLYGDWAKERIFERTPLIHGKQSIGSLRGSSSHMQNPLMVVCSEDATEEYGDVYGINLVYSGSFLAEAEMDPDGGTRLLMGINPTSFAWKLEPGEEFCTPEAVMVYSDEGLGGMSRIYHKLYRNNLCRGPWKNKKRPLLINNWEGTYFDFNEQKLLDIAKVAKKIGLDLFVLDDGWFSNYRDNDKGGLGDWFVNERKFPQGLDHFVQELKKLDMKFGLWFEPEMISPNSDLYRAHPDWAMHIDGRPLTLGRSQCILDLSRAEIRENILSQMQKVLDSTEVTYVKWDFNRNLTEVGSALLPADQQGEVFHRYVLGVYEMMERLLEANPNLLLENCSGGGGRFDPGMLYYSPQIWTSDQTDAIERVDIQYGTSLCYPVSSMGAHVARAPKSSTRRHVPLKTRGHVALSGTFGYELDLTIMTEEEIEDARLQCADFHKYYDIIHYGDLYRLISPWKNRRRAAWSYVSPDRREVLVTYVVMRSHPQERHHLRLAGLDPDLLYRDEATGRVLSGKALMSAGIFITEKLRDAESTLIHFVAI